jgi:hypothetical protein
MNPSHELYAEGVRHLRRLCRDRKLAPTYCRLHNDVQVTSADPVAKSCFSDVWRGTLDGCEVAIKALRVQKDEVHEVKQVGLRHGLLIFGLKQDDQAYIHELVMWQCLRHPNIVPFIGISQ